MQHVIGRGALGVARSGGQGDTLHGVERSSEGPIYLIDVSRQVAARSVVIRRDGRTTPWTGAISPDGSRRYVIRAEGSRFDGSHPIDLGSLQRVARLRPGRRLPGIAVYPRGGVLHASSRPQNAIFTVDVDSGQELSTAQVALGEGTDVPYPLAAIPAERGPH